LNAKKIQKVNMHSIDF